jgi:hypothetical protein
MASKNLLPWVLTNKEAQTFSIHLKIPYPEITLLFSNQPWKGCWYIPTEWKTLIAPIQADTQLIVERTQMWVERQWSSDLIGPPLA